MNIKKIALYTCIVLFSLPAIVLMSAFIWQTIVIMANGGEYHGFGELNCLLSAFMFIGAVPFAMAFHMNGEYLK